MAVIEELVEQLDGLIPREGAKLRIPADPDGNAMAGTRLGYLRLGVEFLRAGLSPATENEAGSILIPLDVEYLLTPDSAPPFDRCEIDEGVEGRPPRRKELGPFGQLIAGIGVSGVVVLLLLGLFAVLSRLFR